jgi:hypothetical protein
MVNLLVYATVDQFSTGDYRGNMSCDAVAASACRVANCALAKTSANTQLFRDLRTELRSLIQQDTIYPELGANFDGLGVDTPLVNAVLIDDQVTITIRLQLTAGVPGGSVITLGTLSEPLRPASDTSPLMVISRVNPILSIPAFPTVGNVDWDRVQVLTNGDVVINTTGVGAVPVIRTQWEGSFTYTV